MIAFHSNWTLPYLKNKNTYEMQDYEILVTILSALKWREKNGSIKMITDKVGKDYYEKLGITAIWDLGVEVTLEEIDKDIDPELFWAAGKIFALDQEEAPIVMIDTDFIVWEQLEADFKLKDVAVIHYEEIDSSIYPGKQYFNMKDTYKFDEAWSWQVKPCNTAFAYINNEKFKNQYTSSSIEFMKSLQEDNNKIVNMVFAEQRIISMIAEKLKLEIFPLENLENLLSCKQKKYTHIWGYKRELNSNEVIRRGFCEKVIDRIKNDFPEYVYMLKNIEKLNTYNI